MNWIHESINRSKNSRNHYKMHEIDIFIKDPLPPKIDPDVVFSSFKRIIPSHLLSGVDIIYIGQFDVFKEKDVNAVFQDGAIYVTNEQSSNEDMIDDIIHELAHSVEEKYTEFIYGDSQLKEEFLTKRRTLHTILDAYNYNPPNTLRTNTHYEKNIDLYLYKAVGYEALWNLISGIFPSPYSSTSLREYFAIGFEFYFMKDKSVIRKLCPALYSKFQSLEFMGEK
jgi:hypothetical protein